jgi:hypothetical protein
MLKHWNRSSRGHRTARALVLALIPVCTALVGCTTSKPIAYLNGYRWNKAELNTYDTLIVSVDGKGYIQNNRILVDPGPHLIVFQTVPIPGFNVSPEKSLNLNVEPCTRYWFEAKRASEREQDFEPRVNYKEHIVGCSVASSSY